MNKFKPHTRNQRRMYRIHEQEERIYDLELLVGSLQRENKKLKERLGKYKIELEKADSIMQSCIFDGKKESKISYRKLLNLVKKNKIQQKEFIEYMNKVIKELELLETGPRINNIDEELNGYLIQRANTFKEILSKYKSIIGASDE